MVEELHQTRQNIEAKKKKKVCQTAELLTKILGTVFSFRLYNLYAMHHYQIAQLWILSNYSEMNPGQRPPKNHMQLS